MNRIGFIGIRERARPGSKENTGNFLHGYAARQIVKEYIDIGTYATGDAEVAALHERISHIGLVAATSVPFNRVHRAVGQQIAMADFIERMKLPVVVFGLGAQAPFNAKVSEANVAKETVRYLEVLSSHSDMIAVRGAFTAELLNSLGIKNVEVVGCQSTFLSRRPDFRFPAIAKGIENAEWERVLVSITKISQELSFVIPAMEGGAIHIGQSAHFEYRLKDVPLGIGFDDLPDEIRSLASKGHENSFSNGSLPFDRYHAWVHERFHQFYNMPEWLDFIRGRFDLAVGTRFHGNMSAMHAGVPALWIVHDSRTQEFCDYLGLPNAPLSEVKKGRSIKELVAEYLDPSRFNAVYPENYARFYNYLERQGVEHRLAPPI